MSGPLFCSCSSGSGAVQRQGNTTDGHRAIWVGDNQDIIADGGESADGNVVALATLVNNNIMLGQGSTNAATSTVPISIFNTLTNGLTDAGNGKLDLFGQTGVSSPLINNPSSPVVGNNTDLQFRYDYDNSQFFLDMTEFNAALAPAMAVTQMPFITSIGSDNKREGQGTDVYDASSQNYQYFAANGAGILTPLPAEFQFNNSASGQGNYWEGCFHIYNPNQPDQVIIDAVLILRAYQDEQEFDLGGLQSVNYSYQYYRKA